MRRSLVALGLASLVAASVVGCSCSIQSGPASPPAPQTPQALAAGQAVPQFPGSAAWQPLPQLGDNVGTYCMDPLGSGWRVFARAQTGSNNAGVLSVVDVRSRGAADPWSCP